MKPHVLGSLVANVAAVATLLVASSASIGCFVAIQKSCASIHSDINQSRVCDNRPNAFPCGNVLNDIMTSDVRGAAVGEAGQLEVDVPTGRQSISVTVFSCRNRVCEEENTEIRTCQGRGVNDAACVGAVTVTTP